MCPCMQPSFPSQQGDSLIDWTHKDSLHAGLCQALLPLSLQEAKGWGKWAPDSEPPQAGQTR